MAPAARASDMSPLALGGARRFPEQFLQLVTRDLETRQRRAEVRGGVADDVVHAVVAERDVELRAAAVYREPARAQSRREFRHVVVEPDAQSLRALGERRHGAG